MSAGKGFVGGMGTGQMGQSGYAIVSAPALDVIGGESFISQSAAATKKDGAKGRAENQADGETGVTLGQADIVKNLNPVNRQSDAVVSEAVFQEYTDLVEEYFKAITK